jgi:ABC-2 type transport system permease protein
MAGKLIGVVGVSLTIVCVYLLGGVLGARSAGQGQLIPANLGALLGWFIAFAALSVLMFGSMFIAVGAACSDMKEAQNMLFPVWIIIMIPMFVWFNVVREPASTFAVAMSLFPPATPMLMVLRTAALPSMPLWQPVLGVVLVVLTTLLCVFAAGRVFRVGILMQGKGAKFTDLIRWALRG